MSIILSSKSNNHGADHCWRYFLIKIKSFHLVSIFHRLVTIFHPSSAQRYTFNNFHILRIHQIPNCLQIPYTRWWIYEWIHYKVRVEVQMLLFDGLRRMVGNQRSISYWYRWPWTHQFNSWKRNKFISILNSSHTNLNS